MPRAGLWIRPVRRHDRAVWRNRRVQKLDIARRLVNDAGDLAVAVEPGQLSLAAPAARCGEYQDAAVRGGQLQFRPWAEPRRE